MKSYELINPDTVRDIENGYTHFYIVGVRTETISMKPKLSMDFMIEYTSDHVKQLMLAADMVDNKLVPTTINEAVEATDMNWLGHEIHGAQLRSRANMCSAHKFRCKHKMERDDLKMFVDLANIVEHTRKQLEDSKVW